MFHAPSCLYDRTRAEEVFASMVCGTNLISYSKAQGCNFFIMLYRVMYRPEFQVHVSTQYCQTGNKHTRLILFFFPRFSKVYILIHMML